MGAGSQPEVVGRYAIYDKIASGGMATVHFGRLVGAAGFTRTVAVKRLHPHLMEEPEFLKTMIDEARLAARIHHPNVVPTLDVVATADELLVVMEYVRGESLSRLLRAVGAQGKRVPLPIASAIAVGALQGLHAAHEATSDRGAPLAIVHRDVSPQNILVGVDGVARVIDFGVAKAAGRLQTTGEGVIKGKIAYMAPEQLSGIDVSRRADVYSMAVVLWEMLAGQRLLQADTQPALMGLVLAGITEPPSKFAPNLPSGLDDLVMRGLALNPDDRFATAREMFETLARVVPPSMSSDVGPWVEATAEKVLLQRIEALSEIESSSVTDQPPPALATSIYGGVGRPPFGGTRKAAPVTDDMSTVASQPSSLSLETPRPSIARFPQRRLPLVGGLAVALGVLGAVIAATALHQKTAEAPLVRSSAPADSTGTSETLRVGPIPTALASAVPSELASSSASPATTTSPDPPSPVAPAPKPQAASRSTTSTGVHAPATATSRPTTATPRAGCNPNFTYDADGNKIFKPECFGN